MTVWTCAHCGAKNRIPLEKKEDVAKCGRCHQPLSPAREEAQAALTLTLRCGQCRVKNRVPEAKLHEGPKCGRCGAPLEHQEVLSGRAVMVSDANFDQAVLRSPLPVLLYAWAPWCSVCSGTGPMVEQLALETKGKVRVAKVNIDTNPKLANQYNILSVPAFFVFDAGQLKLHLPGAVPKHELMLKMAAYL
ncbi:MAG: thioredoxin domain-containing protein [Desulfatitalea sp.]